MKVLEWLCDNTKEGEWIIASGFTIAEKTGLSIKSVRSTVKRLEKSGVIAVERAVDKKSGATLPNKIRVVKRIRAVDPELAMTALAVYTNLVGQRMGKKVMSKKFHCFMPVFNNLARLCVDLDMYVSIYVNAMFFLMPRGWCQKVFGKTYPDPSLLVNEKKARMQYEKYVHHLEAFVPEDTLEKKVKYMAQLVVDLGIETKDGLLTLYRLGLVDGVFLEAMGCGSLPEIQKDKTKVKKYKEILNA